MNWNQSNNNLFLQRISFRRIQHYGSGFIGYIWKSILASPIHLAWPHHIVTDCFLVNKLHYGMSKVIVNVNTDFMKRLHCLYWLVFYILCNLLHDCYIVLIECLTFHIITFEIYMPSLYFTGYAILWLKLYPMLHRSDAKLSIPSALQSPSYPKCCLLCCWITIPNLSTMRNKKRIGYYY